MNIKKKLFLAPIHEYTNYPFRKLCKKYKANYTLVPLISSMGIVSNEKYVDKIDYYNDEEEGIQIFGYDSKIMGKASEILINKFSKLKWIDINCGCPSRNVMQSGSGSALLKHPKKVKEIIKEIQSRDVKVSVKIRLCNTDEKTINFTKTIEPDFLILHGRTVEQMYSGEADWNKIKEIKKNIEYEIVGNGDLKNQMDAKNKMNDNFCDGAMIGRNAISNPGCFSNIEINKENKMRLLREYIDIMKKIEYEEKITLTRVKALNILKGFENSSEVRKKISLCKNVSEIEKILEKEE